MAKLSVIIPTYNEENYIEAALKSVTFADEIIVIDSYSSDKTIEIAGKYTPKILQRKFDNFSNQKNFALSHATGDWVLFLDADERITHSLENEILEVIENPKYEGYKINFPHFFMNRFLYHHDDDVIRLVRRDKASFSGSVHEKLNVDGNIGQLKNFMLHFTYKGLHHYIQKKENYAWFQAEQLYAKNKKTTYFHLFFRPLYRLFNSVVIRGSFRDGIPGITVAVLDAYGVFQRYVKLILLHRNMR